MSIDALRRQIHGEVLTSDDAGYFRLAASGYNTTLALSPEVIVLAENEDDIVAAVRHAAAEEMPVAVISTGHGSYAPVTGGMLVRTTRMKQFSFDDSARTVTLEAGVAWRDVLPALAERGLAAVTGSAPTVGAIGLALGGGAGPLGRTFGYTSDWVTEFRVVTATGAVVTASETSEPELFWALRGGKGGLGIVTRMTLGLLPLPVVYGGSLFWAGDSIEAAYRTWAEWSANAPDEVNTSVSILRLPWNAHAEPHLKGRPVLHLRYVYASLDATPEELQARGEQLLAPMRAAATPVHDTVALMPSSEIGAIHADPPRPVPVWDRGMLLDRLDDTFITTLLGQVGAAAEPPFVAVEVRRFGGQLGLSADQTDAVGGRAAPYSLLIVGTPERALFADIVPSAADRLVAAVQPWVSASQSFHWAGHPSTPEAFAACWPAATHERLSRIRASYDPGRRFAFGP
ncbi:MAG TPA: FAD-binding oxidoreductase [Pseudolysinimonas sp.]|nr:FAD-binding oxidoreductase [Pseudolysinimonas sp.]